MTDTAQRLAALEERLERAEDERAVARLIASYGPLVDSGSADAVAELWEPDGVYDVDELKMTGREEIAGMVESDNHQRWITSGCAHFLGPPRVSVEGGTASAVCHSLMLVCEDGRFVVRRATANHWRLRKGTDGTWRTVNRTSRVLDGRPESPQLLAAAPSATRGEGGSGAESP